MLRTCRGIVKKGYEVLSEHKRMGYPIAVWRDGKAVWIPSEEIAVWEKPKEGKQPRRTRPVFRLEASQKMVDGRPKAP